MIWLVSFIAFIVYWRKKVNAKKSAGENYLDDENYKNVSKIKKIIGAVCIASFVILCAIPGEKNSAVVNNNPSEKVQNDGKSLGVTPEEFVKNFNSEQNKLGKESGQNFNYLSISKTENKDGIIAFSQQNYDSVFLCKKEGKNLLNVQYLSTNSDANIVPNLLAMIKAINQQNLYDKVYNRLDIRDILSKPQEFTDNGIQLNVIFQTDGYMIAVYTEDEWKKLQEQHKSK